MPSVAYGPQHLVNRQWLEELVFLHPEDMGEILRHLCWESQEDRVGKIIQCLVPSHPLRPQFGPLQAL